MAAIHRILVPVKELSGKPGPAVLKAAQLARAWGAELHLYHALTAPLYVDTVLLQDHGLDALESELRQNALRRLESIADALRAHSIRVAVSAEWDYPSHEAIIRRASAVKADLIIVAPHSGRHRAPWLLRLTDWELVRSSPVPLLLVKNSRPYRRPAVLAAVDPGQTHEKPPQLDRDILRMGKSVSVALRGSLHAVHAYARYPMGVPPDALKPGVLKATENKAQRAAQSRLDRILKPVRIARSRRHLIAQQPIDAIAAAARLSRSAIVVMGAISRSGIQRLLIGNTAERILDDLTCDILVIKPAQFANKVPSANRGTRLRVSPPAETLGYSFGYF